MDSHRLAQDYTTAALHKQGRQAPATHANLSIRPDTHAEPHRNQAARLQSVFIGQSCIAVYFRCFASKALHCTLYHAEHFSANNAVERKSDTCDSQTGNNIVSQG